MAISWRRRESVDRDTAVPVAHFDVFDLLRVVAAVMVIFWHSYPLTGKAPVIPLLGRAHETYGSLAVGAFFVMSGFLVTASWARSPTVGFYVKSRIARIWPALVVCVALTTFLVGPLVSSLPLRSYLTNQNTLSYWLHTSFLAPPKFLLPSVFTHNILPDVVNGSLWTLPFEVVAYVAVLVLGVLGALRQRYLVIGLVAVVAMMHLLLVDTDTVFNYRLPALSLLDVSRFGLFFAIGAACCVWYGVVSRRRLELAVAAMAAVVIGVVFGVELPASIGVAMLIVLVGTLSSAAVRRMRQAGDPSYGTYIYAFLIQQVIVGQGWATTPPALFLFATPLSLTAGYASWHLVERPVLRRARNGSDKRRAASGLVPPGGSL